MINIAINQQSKAIELPKTIKTASRQIIVSFVDQAENAISVRVSFASWREFLVY
ncbi:hypothetical protein KC878_00320 [Candidatus Saccharibacteria bacterium]|nr:hypothetical protein [Candidatus Saccharibacteria bacterium]MCB9821059.1 hypothetical protein [Candidatus Nomurabacteria bacterium]